jgi:hypothetical protein
MLRWRALAFLGCVAACLIGLPRGAFGQARGAGACPRRPAAGSVVAEADEVRSVNGVLRVDLDYCDSVEASGQKRYCYLYEGRSEAPTLRVKPGDLAGCESDRHSANRNWNDDCAGRYADCDWNGNGDGGVHEFAFSWVDVGAGVP